MSRALAGLAAAAALTCSGCVFGSADFADETAALRRAGLALECEESVHLGGLVLGLARGFVDAETEPDAALVLEAISSMDVATYRVDADAAAGAGLAVRSFAADGWTPVVRVRSRGENVQVLVRERRGRLRGLMVVALEGTELTLVRIRGDMETLVARVIEDHSGGESEGGPTLVGTLLD